MDKFDKVINEFRKMAEKEKENPIKPKKICRICGKALSIMNSHGYCWMHDYYESPKTQIEKPKRVRSKSKNGKSKTTLPVQDL